MLVLLIVHLAIAATAADSQDASRIEQRFEAAPTPLSKPAQVRSPYRPGDPMPAGAEAIKFTLSAVQIEQSTVFSEAELATLYADLINTEISLAQIYQIASQLTARYDQAGYLLSRALVPVQTIEEGAVRIQVIEGFIDNLIVEGDIKGIQTEYADFFAHYRQQILNSRPIHRAVLERYLLLANEVPGITLKTVLRPSPKTPGATTLHIKIEPAKSSGAIQLDNQGATTSGPWQFLVQGQLPGLFSALGHTSLRLASTPSNTNELLYASLSHRQLISAEGWLAGLDLSASKTEPGDPSLRTLETRSHFRSIAANLSYPLIRTRERNLQVSGGLTRIRSTTSQLGANITNDQLTLLSLQSQFDQSDTLFGGGVTLLTATLTRGLDAFDATSNSRALADSEFTYLQAEFNRTQVLSGPLSANLRLTGQVSNEPLPSSEQIGLGGNRSVRGFEPSEWTGDRGLSGSLELNYRLQGDPKISTQLYAFTDFGKVWRKTATATDPASDQARSIGFGARNFFPNDLAVTLEAARQLNRDSAGNPPDWQAYVRLSIGF